MAVQAELLSISSGLDDLVSLGKAVGDRLRASILQVLHQDSYAVGELCTLFDVPQPALSHHLKILLTAGLVARRREGNSIFYRRASLPGDSAAAAIFTELDGVEIGSDLGTRIRRIHEARNHRCEEFFASNAAEITDRQAEIAEPATYAEVTVDMIRAAIAEGLAGERALEVGPGGGRILASLGALFGTVTGVDSSRTMLSAAKAALADADHIRLRHQDFLTLPDQRRYDALVAAMVIHHQASPAVFFRKAASVLRSGGALVVAELCRHDQQWAFEACGDQWLGFEPAELENWALLAGFESVQSQYLAQKNGFRIQIHRFRIT
jgi:ArsR family transcriptional regulator